MEADIHDVASLVIKHLHLIFGTNGVWNFFYWPSNPGIFSVRGIAMKGSTDYLQGFELELLTAGDPETFEEIIQSIIWFLMSQRGRLPKYSDTSKFIKCIRKSRAHWGWVMILTLVPILTLIPFLTFDSAVRITNQSKDTLVKIDIKSGFQSKTLEKIVPGQEIEIFLKRKPLFDVVTVTAVNESGKEINAVGSQSLGTLKFKVISKDLLVFIDRKKYPKPH